MLHNYDGSRGYGSSGDRDKLKENDMNNWVTSSGIANKSKNKEVEIKEDTQTTYKTTKVKVKKTKKGVVKDDKD